MTPESLKAWRQSEGATRAQAASWLGVSPRTIEGWEQGRSTIPLMVLRLTRALSYIRGGGQ